MSGPSVLIAAFSGRALAQSARRAGYVPLVADCFGDEDMQAAAAASRCVPSLAGSGLLARPLMQALDELVQSAPNAPLGLALGAGFEATPKLLHRLGERFQLIGNSPDVVARTKDPESFFGMLARLGIRHPETRRQPPGNPEGWLRKRVGGSGGGHIVDCPEVAHADAHAYFQRRIPGEAISLLGVLGPRSRMFMASRQWISPTSRQPYRYGGAAGNVTLEEELEARLVSAAVDVADAFGLVGLASFDFLIAEGEPLMLEVNPRPGATLDVLDDEKGTLFAAHVESCTAGGDPVALVSRQWSPPPARATAYFYADRGGLSIGDIDWPDWTADRPARGSRIAAHQPVATVIAEHDDIETARELCENRLRCLADMLYGSTTGRELN